MPQQAEISFEPYPDISADFLFLFHSKKQESYDLFTSFPGADQQTRIAVIQGDELDPAWSPDGTKVAFMSDRSGNFDLYILDTGTWEESRITEDPTDEIMPAWSPDGSKIAFASNRTGNHDLFIIDLETSALLQLTDHPGDDRSPAWSPDGDRIVFHSDRDGDWEIYTIAVEGQELQRLTNSPGTDGFPTWSPDGTRIAYSSAGVYEYDIHILNLNSGEIVPFILPGGDDRAPAWLPDGSGIAFMSDYFGNWEILGLLVEDGSFFRITDSTAEDGFPDLIAMAEKVAPPEDPAVPIQSFIDEYNQSFRDENPEALFGLLHPDVISLYGAETCQNYLNTIVANPIELELVAVTESYLWVWEIDGRSTEIDNAYTLQVLLSTADQVSEQEIHLAKFGEGLIGWFTDCGEPTS